MHNHHSVIGGEKIYLLKRTVTTGILIFSLILVLFVSIVNISIAKNPIQAQVGTEPEIFRVIMTKFGVDKSKGDVIAIITVNNGEASRVKLFESDTFPSISSMAPVPTTATTSNSGIVEYVATFPNVTVDSGRVPSMCDYYAKFRSDMQNRI